MPNSLITGLSGLNSHEQMLDVIGHNLANLNTTGYKSRRTHFADLVYETLRSGTGSSGNLGGVNPAQVGSGSKVSQIDVQFQQGSLENTGEMFDFALQGDGFFIVNNGTQDFYSRAGAFSIDEAGVLVDPATGNRVQRFGTVGEPNGVDPAFQVPGDSAIYVPLGATIPGEATTSANLLGNLPSFANGPVEQVVSSFNAWTAGGTAAGSGTLLNSLDQSTSAYAAGGGDSVVISGTDHDGTTVNTSIAVDDTTTLGDIASAIDGAFSGASATIAADGRITLTSSSQGPSMLSLTLADAAGNAGALDFAANAPIVATTGADGTVVPGAIEVFDMRGQAHTVSLDFQKQADGTWSMTAGVDPTSGTVVDGSVGPISFNSDGSFQSAGDMNLAFDFGDGPQSINLSLGSGGGFEGWKEMADDDNIAAQQDGFPPGAFVSVQVRSDGVLEGISSTGRTFPLAQLAIASFSNPGGLHARGDNTFEASLSSGDVQVGTGLSGNRGAVVGGQLESSNVDIAMEFTRLIVAQRGFSANARTITVTDEVLEELTSLIR